MNNIWKYGMKVWLTTALTGPFILLVIDFAQNYSQPFYLLKDELLFYFIAVIISIFLSCLPWLLFIASVYAIQKRCFNLPNGRLLVQIAGFSIVLFTFISVFAVHDHELSF